MKYVCNRNKERGRRRDAGDGKKSTRNSIKIGEICIVPWNVGKSRDVVERLRGNRNLGAKEEERGNLAEEERGGPE